MTEVTPPAVTSPGETPPVAPTPPPVAPTPPPAPPPKAGKSPAAPPPPRIKTVVTDAKAVPAVKGGPLLSDKTRAEIEAGKRAIAKHRAS